MTAAPVLSIDFETASLIDLRQTGVHTYAEHSSTRVLCMAYAFDKDPVEIWAVGDPFPLNVLDHVMKGLRVQAWNAGFEWVIWNKVLLRQLGPAARFATLSLGQLSDTMARAAFWGLPLQLDQAAPAAGLSIKKDKQGHALMMRMCKPRTFDPVAGTATWWHETDQAKFNELLDYCKQDVEVERALGNVLPDLPPDERRTRELDLMINAEGIGVDYELVMKLRDLAFATSKAGNLELARLTNGQVTSVNQTAALLAWLKFHGYPYDNLRRATVEGRLEEEGLSAMERAALELRADVARTSAAKLDAMLNACPVRGAIGEVRGMLQYYGANRTGRWAGRLIQLQNMPRGVIGKKEVPRAIQAILNGATHEQIELLFGPAMGVISSLLRSCIVPRPGRKFAVADFSQIEARVVAWLAGQTDILQVFASGKDVYIYTAAKVKGVPESTIDKDSPLRQLGKVLVLACGFGMSGPKFKDTAETYGVMLTSTEAIDAVKLWRNANSKIVDFWWACDRAAKTVLAQPNQVIDVGPVRFGMWGPHMVIRLPSGRPLVYRNAMLQPSKDRPGTDEITYMGINQYTRQWTRLRTYGGKLVENITQAVARDVMRDAMLECDRRNIPVRLTVHDELITEPLASAADATLTDVLAIMHWPPKWAAGLPVAGDGWVGDRYKK
jgi:DNA polymerase